MRSRSASSAPRSQPRPSECGPRTPCFNIRRAPGRERLLPADSTVWGAVQLRLRAASVEVGLGSVALGLALRTVEVPVLVGDCEPKAFFVVEVAKGEGQSSTATSGMNVCSANGKTRWSSRTGRSGCERWPARIRAYGDGECLNKRTGVTSTVLTHTRRSSILERTGYDSWA
jgi:hypothetical protein